MVDESHKVAIGDLLNKADVLSKKVVSAYNTEVSYNVNLQNLKKFDASHLEATATFLGFTVRGDANKKLYKNLTVICDRIILKIESFFETECNDCGEKYCNKTADEPLLTCQLCLQGSHNCAKIQERFNALNEVPEGLRLVGMVWMCFECLKKNNLALSPTPNSNDENTKLKTQNFIYISISLGRVPSLPESNIHNDKTPTPMFEVY